MQGHATVMVMECKVGRMCKGCKGEGKGEGVRGHPTVRARGCTMVTAMACEVRRTCERVQGGGQA